MAYIADSYSAAKILGNEINAFDNNNDCIYKYPDNHYPLLALCDLAVKYLSKEKLSEGILKLENMKTNKTFSNRTLNKYKSYLAAMNGNSDEALTIIGKDISRFPTESQERIRKRIVELAGNNEH